MREIKFRAKVADSDYENEKQIEMIGSFVHFTGFIGSENNIGYVEQLEEIYGVGWFNVDLKTLGQYTGLKDKDGREIFEGDLYKFIISHDIYNPESGHTTFEVVHVKAVTFEDGAFYHGTHLLSEIIEFDDSFTYVGNIYENPELMEESQNGTK